MQHFGEHYSEHRFMLIDIGRGFTIRGISKFTADVTFLKFSIERGMIVSKDKIGVISAQLYVTFW